MATRLVVRVSQEVAPRWWLQPFANVVAAAERGENGLRAEQQESDKAGFWKIDGKDGEATLIEGRSGNCELFQQCW